MKKTMCVVLVTLLFASMALGQTSSDSEAVVSTETNLVVNQGGAPTLNKSPVSASTTTAVETGAVTANPSSMSVLSLKTEASKIPDYKTPPVGVGSPYLPMINHDGWKICGNGPSKVEGVYDREFDLEAIKNARKVLASMGHNGPVEFLWGICVDLNASFGGDDYSHRGRGITFVNSLERVRRPVGEPLLVFLDGNGLEAKALLELNYVYVGHISAKGKVTRDWDQAYKGLACEAWPFNVGVLLVSGGPRGVSVLGTTSTGVSGATSQNNYAISLFGAKTDGISEGEFKQIAYAEGYRYDEKAAAKQRALMETPVGMKIAEARAQYKAQLAKAVADENERQVQKAQRANDEEQKKMKAQIDSAWPTN